jgi:D-3-phosphoglycerate dehydrogenase / 2-oxoglutarate reductase
MKVLIADRFEQSGIDGLQALGATVVYEPELADATLIAAIRKEAPDVLVVRATLVTAEIIEQGTFSLIVRAGAGLNSIDVDAARRRGIPVVNCPGLNAIAVAELTIGLIVSLDRRIPDNVAELRAGRWNKKEFSHARGLYGRALGLLGFGQIGQEVARRAQAFQMPIFVWSRRFATAGSKAELPAGIEATIVATPEELAERSDVLSVHLALTPETRGLIGRDILDRLKPGSFLVNTARADVVDTSAVAAAVVERKLRVALDVYEAEPALSEGTFRDPLLQLPGVIGTHHIGGSTDQAQEAIAGEVVRIIRDWSRHEHHNAHS